MSVILLQLVYWMIKVSFYLLISHSSANTDLSIQSLAYESDSTALPASIISNDSACSREIELESFYFPSLPSTRAFYYFCTDIKCLRVFIRTRDDLNCQFCQTRRRRRKFWWFCYWYWIRFFDGFSYGSRYWSTTIYARTSRIYRFRFALTASTFEFCTNTIISLDLDLSKSSSQLEDQPPLLETPSCPSTLPITIAATPAMLEMVLPCIDLGLFLESFFWSWTDELITVDISNSSAVIEAGPTVSGSRGRGLSTSKWAPIQIPASVEIEVEPIVEPAQPPTTSTSNQSQARDLSNSMLASTPVETGIVATLSTLQVSTSTTLPLSALEFTPGTTCKS